jgi:hypothetical protein
MGDLTICTWFVGDQCGQESLFPQMSLSSSTIKFQRIYWECIELYFRSARLTNPSAVLVFFCSSGDHPLIGEFGPLLRGLGVKLEVIPFLSRPPSGFTERFGNQLYICDIVHHIAQSGGGRGSWLVLDSDCLIVRPLEALESEIERSGLLTLDLLGPDDEEINGLNQAELTKIGEECGWLKPGQRVRYYGGEFFAATGEVCRKLDPILEEMLARNIVRWRQGKSSIREEAHLLSLAYARLGFGGRGANRFARRIWTTFRVNDASTDDMQL